MITIKTFTSSMGNNSILLIVLVFFRNFCIQAYTLFMKVSNGLGSIVIKLGLTCVQILPGIFYGARSGYAARYFHLNPTAGFSCLLSKIF